MFENNFFKLNPFSFDNKYHFVSFKKSIYELTIHHYNNCNLYKKILKRMKFKKKNNTKLEELPMLPTRLFKNFDLLSVSKDKIIKTLVSSGTSSFNVSKIYLDELNSLNQVKALKNLIESIIGKERLPMIIVDKDPKLSDRKIFNAKTTAIYGFSYFGKNHFYLLDKNGNINYQGLNIFLEKFSNKKFFIFGFTSLIYQILLKKISTKRLNSNFYNGILLHGGGWKKLEKWKIKNKKFKNLLTKKFKLKKIYNYYGMVEQAGSIFLECEKCGGFKTSRYSDVIIRDKNFDILGNNKIGMIQLLSNIPTSYPGHNILTEDRGEIIKKGDCISGHKGKCFLVHGRLEKAELKGCSDVR